MPTYEELLQERDELLRRVTEQEKRISSLEKLIEELQRKGKRQAGPFSKGEPKKDPKRPGRKPGSQYGRRATRPVPPQVDKQVEVPCPLFCGACQGEVELQGKQSQYQIDLPVLRPTTTEFIVHYGQCKDCGERAQSRHSQQISSAVGEVGGVQLGPGVIGWAAYLNKTGGLSYCKIASLFEQMMGLRVSRSALCRAVARLAEAAQPSYEQLIANVAGSSVVYPDETGWRIGGQGAWLWVFVTAEQTVYKIASGRGFTEASAVLGAEYAGIIGADGWAPYRRFEQATLQTCLAHLLRRCREMLQIAEEPAAQFPGEVQALLKSALALRDRLEAKQISPLGALIVQGRLKGRLRRLLEPDQDDPANQRLAKHLRRSEKELFVFLDHPEVEATNWPSEQAIRPAVINRKTCAGNRTAAGAHSQEILVSVLRTCHQRGLKAPQVFSQILRDPTRQAHRELTSIPPAR